MKLENVSQDTSNLFFVITKKKIKIFIDISKKYCISIRIIKIDKYKYYSYVEFIRISQFILYYT